MERLLGAQAVRYRTRRNRQIEEAAEKHGYSQKEVADYFGMHYSTRSKLLAMPNAKIQDVTLSTPDS